MHKSVSWLAVLIVIGAGLIVLPSNTSATPSEGWLVTIFMAGDNSLGDTEDPQMQVVADIAEIVASSSEVDVLVLADELGDGNSFARHIKAGVSTPVSISGLSPEANFGDEAIYYRGIAYGQANYPHTKNAIVLWNHGIGWGGVCMDETDNDYLQNYEINNILEYAKSVYGNVEVVGFDACYMSQADIIYECKDYADIFVGSVNYEPWDGWNYDFLAYTFDNTTPEHFGELACWLTNEYYGTTYHTIACFNLTNFDLLLMDEFNLLFQGLKHKIGDECSNISAAMGSSMRYTTPRSDVFYDMYDFAVKLKAVTADGTIEMLCDNLMTAYTSTLIVKNCTSGYGMGFYASSGQSGTTSLSSSYWEGYGNLNICRYTSFDEFQHQLFTRANTDARVPAEPNVTTSSSTITINGLGIQYKLGKGAWRSTSVSISMTDDILYYRAYNGYDYTEMYNETVTGSRINVVGGYISTTYTFQEGWNLFSPFIDGVNEITASSLCKKIALDNTIIYGREDDGSYHAYVYGNTLTDYYLYRGKAYYVYVSEDVEIYLDGNLSATQTISLNEGWNLVGYTANTELYASEIDTGSIVRLIAKKGANVEGNYLIYEPTSRRGEDFSISLGDGLYIYATEAGVIEI